MEINKKNTASARAYTIIKERIISGEYEPGRMLNEIALSNEMGISRTPIREALSSLEHEMFVTIYPKQGTVVSPLNLKVVSDVFQTRMLLEPFIILQYGALIDQNRVLMARKMQLKIQSENSTASFHYKADQDLHQIILDSNQNQYIAEALARAYGQNQRIRILTGEKSEVRLQKSCEEHLAIIDCLLRSDYEAAAQRMRAHLEGSWRVTLDLALAAD